LAVGSSNAPGQARVIIDRSSLGNRHAAVTGTVMNNRK